MDAPHPPLSLLSPSSHPPLTLHPPHNSIPGLGSGHPSSWTKDREVVEKQEQDRRGRRRLALMVETLRPFLFHYLFGLFFCEEICSPAAHRWKVKRQRAGGRGQAGRRTNSGADATPHSASQSHCGEVGSGGATIICEAPPPPPSASPTVHFSKHNRGHSECSAGQTGTMAEDNRCLVSPHYSLEDFRRLYCRVG